MPPSHHNALPAGYTLHWYVIDSVLGQGGFGITYLAHDSNLDQKVAIKEFLPADLATRSSDSTVHPLTEKHSETYGWGLDRFLHEARTLAKFRHPSIVRVLSVFEANNSAYMVMEFEEGESLNLALNFRRLQGEEELRRMVLSLLDGLDLVHAAGFIHRDIKPDNIYLRSDGSPVLLDFGSARQALGAETRTLTALVSPGYAPFEQYDSSRDGDSKQGPWTDIYALGATLYRAVTGKGPPEAMARVTAVVGGSDILVPAREAAQGDYSADFLAAIDRALEFLPENRPQSIAEWRAMLTGEAPATVPAGEVPTVAAPVDPREAPTVVGAKAAAPTVAAGAPGADAPPTDPAAPQGAVRPGRKLPLAAAAVVLLLAVGGGAWLALGGRSGPDEAPPVAQAPPGGVAATPGGVQADAGAKHRAEEEAQRQRAEAEANRRAEEEAQRQRAEAEAKRRAEDEAERQHAEAEANRRAEGEAQRLRVEAEAKRRAEEEAERQRAEAEAKRRAEEEAAATRRAEEEAARQRAEAEAKRRGEEEAERQRAEAETKRRLEAEAERQRTQAAARDARLAELLALAEQDVAALRLTSPPGRNAVERYQAVLAERPGDAEAMAGLRRVVERYLGLAERASVDGDLDRAESYLDRAEQVQPGAEDVAAAREALAAARAEAERASAQAVSPAPAVAAPPPAGGAQQKAIAEELARLRAEQARLREELESRDRQAAAAPAPAAVRTGPAGSQLVAYTARGRVPLINCEEQEPAIQSRLIALARSHAGVAGVKDGGIDTSAPWYLAPTGPVPRTPEVFDALAADGLDGAVMVEATATGGFFCFAGIEISVYGVDAAGRRVHEAKGSWDDIDTLLGSVLNRLLAGG